MIGTDVSSPWFIGGFAGELGPRRFTSCQDCPKCSALATHWLDQPRIPTGEELALYDIALEGWEDLPVNEGTAVYAFGEAEPVRCVGGGRGKPRPEAPLDESDFEVMRICRECGHRWGNV